MCENAQVSSLEGARLSGLRYSDTIIRCLSERSRVRISRLASLESRDGKLNGFQKIKTRPKGRRATPRVEPPTRRRAPWRAPRTLRPPTGSPPVCPRSPTRRSPPPVADTLPQPFAQSARIQRRAKIPIVNQTRSLSLSLSFARLDSKTIFEQMRAREHAPNESISICVSFLTLRPRADLGSLSLVPTQDTVSSTLSKFKSEFQMDDASRRRRLARARRWPCHSAAPRCRPRRHRRTRPARPRATTRDAWRRARAPESGSSAAPHFHATTSTARGTAAASLRESVFDSEELLRISKRSRADAFPKHSMDTHVVSLLRTSTAQ